MLYEFVSVSAVSWFSFLSAARRSASFRTSVSSTDMSNADAMVRINWDKLTERLFPDLDVDHEPFDAGAYRKEQWKSPEHAKISKPGHYLPSSTDRIAVVGVVVGRAEAHGAPTHAQYFQNVLCNNDMKMKNTTTQHQKHKNYN